MTTFQTFHSRSERRLQKDENLLERFSPRYSGPVRRSVKSNQRYSGSVRTFGDDQSKVIESMVRSHPDLIADCLDEFFTREVIKAVPGYVERTLQWSQMEAALTPSTATNTYIREATRTYVLGFPQASIALCRAALEQG